VAIKAATFVRNATARLARTALTWATAFNTRRLIVVLTPGHEMRTGGVLTIGSFYQETRALAHIHRATTALCAVPGDPFILKYSWFENDNYILDFEALLARCGRLDYLQLHIPDYAVNRMVDWLGAAAPPLVERVGELHLNVLVQNIDVIRRKNLGGLVPLGRVTCTAAHEAYTSATTRAAFGVPLHRLSTCNGPERYSRRSYREKEPLLLVSHDEHPMKDRILQDIAERVPHLRIEVVQNMSFGEYLALARRAKWSVTFGEGLDSYFVDPVFSGGVSFAVFNDRFFTPAFAALETVYPSWEACAARLPADLQRLDEPAAYERCWHQAFDLLSDLYNTERFRENLRLFYRGQYTFP